MLNITCLTWFTQIILNKVKHVVCQDKGCSKNATNSQQVVSLSQLSSKTYAKYHVFNFVYSNYFKQS